MRQHGQRRWTWTHMPQRQHAICHALDCPLCSQVDMRELACLTALKAKRAGNRQQTNRQRRHRGSVGGYETWEARQLVLIGLHFISTLIF